MNIWTFTQGRRTSGPACAYFAHRKGEIKNTKDVKIPHIFVEEFKLLLDAYNNFHIAQEQKQVLCESVSSLPCLLQQVKETNIPHLLQNELMYLGDNNHIS